MSLINITFYQLYVPSGLILSYYVDWELFYIFSFKVLYQAMQPCAIRYCCLFLFLRSIKSAKCLIFSYATTSSYFLPQQIVAIPTPPKNGVMHGPQSRLLYICRAIQMKLITVEQNMWLTEQLNLLPTFILNSPIVIEQDT